MQARFDFKDPYKLQVYFSLRIWLTELTGNMAANSNTYFSSLSFLSKRDTCALMIFNTISLITNISANAFLLYTIKKVNLGNSISYRFIIALSISDLCVGAIAQPLYSLAYADIITNRTSVKIVGLVAKLAAYMSSQFSGFMIFLISLDRYLHMKHLNRYNVHMTHRRGLLLIYCCLIITFLLGVLMAVASFYRFDQYLDVGTILTSAIVFILIIFNYVKACVSLHKRVSAMNESRNTSAQTNPHYSDLQFAKGIFCIMASLTVRYIPYFIFGILVSLPRDTTSKELYADFTIAFFWSIQLVFLGAFSNVVILFVFSHKLQNFFVMKVLCRTSMEG